MASSSSAVNDSVILTEGDIPGASLAGRNPSSLKNEELRFWLRCPEDSLKGLKTKALLVKRYAQINALILIAPAGISPRGEIPRRHPSSSRVY